MPGQIPIIKQDLDHSYDSPSDFGSSHREPSEPPDSEDNYLSRCGWYGEDFFQSSLKWGIFKTAPSSATADYLKDLQREAEMSFPFVDCIEKLDTIKAIQIPKAVRSGKISNYTIFTTKLGAVADQVDHRTRNELRFMIQTQGGYPLEFDTHEDDSSSSSSPSPNDASFGGDKRIALCSSRLYEWAEQEQKHVQCNSRQISIDPPLSEVTINCDGAEFFGTAKKKNMAKHIACKQACEHFRIAV